ncbi:Putative peptidoglycan binding domain-containing protein [Caloranaerobacter azorensis DSM 13643]|uniref:Putative peptidoglycan binding domain-containing protein n=1 Tax=Caloranaerobacter azorensis DSM 13643 TaxID=1121264 RepID=A0A1M5W2P1_9FIRM|nr:L,D-transpeptidase family protein [Caloranaerobacter azorensis]SHH81772.1 Putative peptidoglycan binding domain-containing protein [Caloranaerobacter azorensis DSM 13643]
MGVGKKKYVSFIMFIVIFLLLIDLSELKKDDLKGTSKLYGEYEIWEKKQLNEQYNYENLAILVDIDKKYLYLYDVDTNKVIKKYVVATGKPSTPTPIGSFKIIEKAKWGGGFGSRWMRINVPWGRYGIHGTNKPTSIGYNASHGCVRMRNKDIEELYSIVKYNTPVILFSGPFGPFGYGFRILKPGDRGSDVQEVQRRLKKKGYYYGPIDGIYGNSMKSALFRFLKDNKLPKDDRIGYLVYKKLGIILME